MLVSLFTPTHKPDWILETYESVVEQTYGNWQWVIVPNQGAEIPEPIPQDPRVVIVPAPSSLPPGVGALKRFACQQCQGELLVELDHDDRLTPNALELLVLNARQGIGFQYSDFVNLYSDGHFLIYDSIYGWDHPYLFSHQGNTYVAMRDFDPSPASLGSLTFGPNHVRAWTRAAYEAAGGHDPNLAVVDDYDLICRTYLTGTPFHHIPEVLYLYRLHGENTWKDQSQTVSQLRAQLSRKYLYPIIDEWCRRHHYSRLSLSSTSVTPDPYLLLDRAQVLNTQQFRYQGSPIPDDSVGCIRAYDFLQYLAPPQIHRMMNEFYRVLAPGGWVLTYTPSTDGWDAFGNPSYRSFWNQESFDRYLGTDRSPLSAPIHCRFRAHRLWNEHPTAEHQQQGMLYIRADLVAAKGQREPQVIELPDGTHRSRSRPLLTGTR